MSPTFSNNIDLERSSSALCTSSTISWTWSCPFPASLTISLASACTASSSRSVSSSLFSSCGLSATEHPTPPGPGLCGSLRAGSIGPGLCPLRLLLDRLGGSWLLLRGLQLGYPRGEGGVGLGELGDDGVRPPAGLPLGLQLLGEDAYRLVLGGYECTRLTIHSRFSLRRVRVQPHVHPSI